MTVTRIEGPMTYAKMRGIMSFFSALLKGKKDSVRDFIHKMVSSQHLCHHLKTKPERSQKETPCQNLKNSTSAGDSQLQPSDFDYLKVIGKGTFGKVLLARQRESGSYYAVKVLQKQAILYRREQRHVMVERSVLLKGLQHPFLVGLHFSFQTPNTLYFVLDYVNGGELFYHLQREGRFSEPRARFYTAETASALGYLHSLDIVYRDLKPENILLDGEGHVMLTDFGLCKEGVAIGGIMETFCGTPEYLAPEVLQGYPYSPTVDWWGLGCVLFEMLYGLPPFYSRSKVKMFENILHAPLCLRGGVSAAARSLMEGLLERDRCIRLGSNSDFAKLQSHPFFSNINWEDLLARRITPPFVPKVAGPGDVRYVDPQFTRQPLPTSVGLGDQCQAAGASDAFLGFSYMPPVWAD